MKSECPVCGQPGNDPADHQGQQIMCPSCRTTFEIRYVPTAEEEQEAAEIRSQLLTVTLPAVLFGFVLLCGISANVLHSRHSATESAFAASSAADAVIRTADPSTRQSVGLANPSRIFEEPIRTSPTGASYTTAPRSTRTAPAGTADQRIVSADARSYDGVVDSLTIIPVQIDIPPTDPPAPAVADLPLSNRFVSGMVMDFSEDLHEYLQYADSQLIKRTAGRQQAEVLYESPSLSATTVNLNIMGMSFGTDDGQVIWSAGTPNVSYLRATYKHAGKVLATQTSGGEVWSCSDDGSVIGQSDIANRSRKYELPGRPISAEFVTPHSVVIGLEDRRVLVGNGYNFRKWQGFRSATPPKCVSLSGDGKYLVVAGDSRAEVRDVTAFHLQQVFQLPDPIVSVTLSHGGELLAVGGQDGKLIVYSTWSRRVIATYQFDSPPIRLRFPQYGRSPIAAATATGELLRIELKLSNLTSVERNSIYWTPLSQRYEASQWTPLHSFMCADMEDAFDNAEPVTRDLAVASGRQPSRIQYLQKHDNIVVAFGCGLSDVKRVVWFNGVRQAELPVIETTESQVHLDWSPPADIAPVLLFETEDAAMVTIPYDLMEADTAAVSDTRDDETYVLRPGRSFETLDDKFQLLVLPTQTAITSEIKGRGVIVAQPGSELPEKLRGPIAVICTKDHLLPTGFPASGQSEFATDQLYLNPIPAVQLSN